MRCAGSDLDQDPMTFARHESSLAEMGQMAEGQEKQSMSRINTSYCTFDDAFIKMFFFFFFKSSFNWESALFSPGGMVHSV